MIADTRQVHMEGFLELAIDIPANAIHVLVHAAIGPLPSHHVFPVWAPLDFFNGFTGNLRERASSRRCLGQRRVLQARIVIGERLVVIVDLRQVRVGEDVQQLRCAPAGLELQLAVDQRPAAPPFFLVFPVFWIADTGLGFDVIEPDIFHTLAVGPRVFARYGTSVATNTLVQVKDECELCTYFHEFLLVILFHETISACRFRPGCVELPVQG